MNRLGEDRVMARAVTSSPQAALAGVVLVGALLAFAAPIDGGLSRTTGSLPAALVDFLGGALVVLTVIACTGRLRQMAGIRTVPRGLLVGGACGAFFVTGGVLTIDTLGAGGVAAATITGQLIASVLLDRFGVLGLDRTPVTPLRLAGVAALIGGTLLITTA
jgi:transporter family-2 protein